MAGFLMLSREIQSHWIFDDPEKLKAWMVILLEVNYAPKKTLIKGHLLECAIGESLYSLDTWAEKFGKNWDKSKVRRFFDLLKNDHMITTKSDTVTTRLTVCNYLKYNKPCNANDTQTAQARHSSDTLATPTKEVNKDNKEKKESSSRFTPPTLEEVSKYCRERNNGVNPDKWINHYTANGWKVGKASMKDWRAAVRTWEQKESPLLPEAVDLNIYARDKDGNKLFKVAI